MRWSGFAVRQGDLLPRGFGIAWWRPRDDTAVVLPIPANLLAGAIVRAHDLARQGVRPSRLRALEHEARLLRLRNAKQLETIVRGAVERHHLKADVARLRAMLDGNPTN